MQVVNPSFSGETQPTNSAAANCTSNAAIHQVHDAVGRIINLALSSVHLVIAPDETAWAVID
jgi:hypothetical protein